MEMKLDTHRIKTLRLNQSWSQEKLAEKAGLNPRTIQRVETDGSASLHTRLCLSRALGVEPQELDLAELVVETTPADTGNAPNQVSPLRSVYHLPLLLLISLVYLAWTPLYFSLSLTNFRLFGGFSAASEWVATCAFWLLLALPWMSLVYYRHRQQMGVHLAYLAALAGFSFLGLLQEELARMTLTLSLYLCGVALLYTCYRSTAHQAQIRRLFFICLATYLFVWLLQGRVVGFMVGSWFYWQRDLGVPLPWVSFPDYVLRMLRDIPQLFPLVLVLLFDLGRSRTNKDNQESSTSRMEFSNSSL